ncbi:bifunctional glutathionylspermidine amidase/synthase [Vibrio sp. CAIM 722]|uniref:Bifunctional glutathionylspermidine amidase/synthase n=1 Tax=Vibrio eleionomae TaxID=2653505 RepID=A0A7X4LP75_9VIBR|nr:bifunctional glutathionylspermidine amidase/synthase [Vibrio eleionomae]MZI95608.1 bifunctional glutathionylspermidine amidase/synthase [Vibrio eleionomae]
MHKLQFPPEPFGTVLGHAPGGVAIFSSDYKSADPTQFQHNSDYRSYIGNEYMGHKWQCVEFARRWLYLNRGLVFTDVPMAYDIFALRYLRRVEDDALLPFQAFKNGGMKKPEAGALLIWAAGGDFEVTGHVAVITEVFDNKIRIAEQNLEHCKLPAGQQWCRELQLEHSNDGHYRIIEGFSSTKILGWMIQTAETEHAEPDNTTESRLFELNSRVIQDNGQFAQAWLDHNDELLATFSHAMEGDFLTESPTEQLRYFRMSATAERELIRATNELHLMYLHATDKVLRDDTLLANFNIPQVLWPRLRRSWQTRRNQMINGRFDFCLTHKGLKVYEYNADSASCHTEAGLIQGLWAKQARCEEGEDAGEDLLTMLAEEWRHSDAKGTVHILQDEDKEENYHALFMQRAMAKAGIHSKIIRGLTQLHWNDAGEVVDSEEEAIHCVWKTWAWATALDQIRHECEDDALAPPIRTGSPDAPVRLVDLLLRPRVKVFEPLWTLIPSNKAILPVLWNLFPNHRYLLDCSFELTDELKQRGYVIKPIAGRCGDNIQLVDKHQQQLEQTEGRFSHQQNIYQELWRLPQIDGYRVQICTFAVGGSYGGSCIRVDQSLIITTDSDVLPLRVVPDNSL